MLPDFSYCFVHIMQCLIKCYVKTQLDTDAYQEAVLICRMKTLWVNLFVFTNVQKFYYRPENIGIV